MLRSLRPVEQQLWCDCQPPAYYHSIHIYRPLDVIGF